MKMSIRGGDIGEGGETGGATGEVGVAVMRRASDSPAPLGIWEPLCSVVVVNQD